ncbi:restriction endonuclease subunit S [Streptococcus parasuis]|uniref:restriction endonuclease subunit S n=1 Tax=Streptococcus parasuis TaxID=1501662 RepID=UPI00370DBC83
MSEWKKKQLQEIAILKPTETLKKGDIAPNIPMANIKEFQRDVVKIDYGEFRGGTKFRNGDTLLAKITPCLENGKTAFVNCLQEDEIGFGSTEFIVLRAKENIDERFLYYLSISPEFRKQAISLMEGTSGRKRVNENALKISDFLIPDFEEQKKIANILSAIDDKISLNNQINEELEAMAKTLYDYWFVQFDFPDENGKPYKSSGGKMVYNDQLKREIPEGWGVKRLGEICNPTSGYPFASNTYVQDGKFKIYTIKNVQDNGILPITDNTLDTLPANLPEKCILGPGDMLMSLTGNVGRVGIVFEDNALLNQRVLKIESKYKAFIFQFLKDPRTRSLLENTATGTSQKNLSPKDVMDISIIFPGFNVLIEFEQISNEILLQITSNNQQNQELTQLRDWLLPMLMNGQVRVEDKTWKL